MRGGEQPPASDDQPPAIKLDPAIIELHLVRGEGAGADKAKMIWQMMHPVYEYDSDNGPGVARPGEW